jgi:hypothetical protein
MTEKINKDYCKKSNSEATGVCELLIGAAYVVISCEMWKIIEK